MHVINTRNVHQALPQGIKFLLEKGHRNESRNGGVVVSPVPVTTVYQNPCERVMFWGERDANPVFHLVESLWMMAGRNDVAYVSDFVKRMATFSDDGLTLNGAYGYRWRQYFVADQLAVLVRLLTDFPKTRRAVLSMWDANRDLRDDEKLRDVPCNTQVYFWRNGDALDMTVLCRSNDIIWGAYGANAVHFSVLQEYMAAAIGVQVGRLYQVSNNFHAYHTTLEPVASLAGRVVDMNAEDPYVLGFAVPVPMVTNPRTWLHECSMFCRDEFTCDYRNEFLPLAAIPLVKAYRAWKVKDDPHRFVKAYDLTNQCLASDWRLAAHEWFVRRQQAAESGKGE